MYTLGKGLESNILKMKVVLLKFFHETLAISLTIQLHVF